MGYKWTDIECLTLVEFTVAYDGYRRNIDEYWDIARHIGSWIINGYAKEPITPRGVMELQKDEYGELRPITSDREAKELLKQML